MESDRRPSAGLQRERSWRGALVLALVAGMLLAGLVVLAHPAAATVTAGSTTPLVNAGQPIRDGSTAVPVFGITAASTSGADQLLSITVDFSGTGFSPANTGDLRALSTNPANSGVALYEDVGVTPGALDASDVGVTAATATWTGSSAVLAFAEPFPAVPAGAFDWILVVRTSSNAAALVNGDQIVAAIPANGIVFSGAVTQPATAVSANALSVSLTSVTDRLAPQTWIGPVADAVNAQAVLGVRILDGGVAPNAGIADTLSEVVVQIIDVSGTYGGNSLLPPNVDPVRSGISLYRDSNGNGVWDPADTGLTLASISLNCVPAFDVQDWCLFPNAEPIPHTAGAAPNYFVVVRSNAMGSGDEFRFMVEAGQIVASGVHPDDANRPTLLAPTTSSSLLGDDTPPCVTPGCGQPFGIHWANPTGNPYLFPADRTLYFGVGMGATPVPGEVVLSASDGESGLGRAIFSSEPSLAGSPAPVLLSGSGVDVTVVANYSFNATSTAASSPATVTVYDAVGNHATAPSVSFVRDATNPMIVPAPGWTDLPGRPFYVNDTGTLFFSPWISGRQTVSITVDLADTIAGLKNATATAEPSLAGGPNYAQPTNLGGATDVPGWTVSYAFNATSTSASSPATITACDNVANCANASFPYALDAAAPNVTVLAPAPGAVLSGPIVIAATASDAGSGVEGPLQAEVLGQSSFMDMIWNGTAWVLPLPTALYPDGAQRIVVRAFDHVGNEGVATVDVWFDNAAVPQPPVVTFASPAADSLVSGVVTIQVAVSDAIGVAGVNLTAGTATVALASLGNGVYAVSFDTARLPTGTETISVTAVDSAGRSTTVSESLRVDNTPPAISLAAPSSDHGAITLRATVTDTPAGVASVAFVIDGKTYAAVPDGHGGYSVTIWTTAADDGAHGYEAVAMDRAGNTAVSAGTFTVSTPTDYLGAFAAFAPVGTFLVLLVALVLGLILLARRRKKPAAAPGPETSPKAPAPPPPKAGDEF